MTTRSPSDPGPVERVHVDELLAELADTPGALAFDGDGTLWRGDVGEDFFEGILRRGVAEVAQRALRAVAEEAGVAWDSPVRTAHALYEAYLAGRFAEERVCEMMTWICAGQSEGEVRAQCEGLVADIAGRVHPEVAAVLRATRDREVFVVSASPRPIVEAAAAVLGVPRSHVLAATPVVVDGAYAPAVHRPIPYGPGKASALHGVLGSRSLAAAFGDNVFDAEMLRLARYPVAVRPKPRLLGAAQSIAGLRILEPQG